MIDLATLATLEHDRTTAPLEEWPYPITSEVVARIIHRGEPQAWQRPIVVRAEGGLRTITPAATLHAERALAGDLLLALNGIKPDPGGAFGLRARFHLGNRRRVDLDNLLKIVMESLSRTVMADDRQVVEVYASKILRDPDPRTEMIVYRLGVYR